MRRKRRTRSKRKLIFSLLLPLFLISSTAVGYGFWHDYIQLEMSLTAAQKPSIAVGLITTPNDIVKLVVNKSSWIIESTEPNPVQVQINIMNNGTTPINDITATDALPNDWRWQQEEVQVQLIQTDEPIREINAEYFETIYNPSTYTLTVTIHDIKAAIGKYLEQNEKIKIIFYMEYTLIGTVLPEQSAHYPPQYTNLPTATARIGGWSSDPTTASNTFTTQISWVGEAD